MDKEVQKEFDRLKGGLNKDIINGLSTVRTGTITTGDPTTDLIIGDIRTFINDLHNNIKGQ